MGILLRLAGYALRISPFRLVLAYVCLIGSTLLSLAIPRLLGISIDRVLESGDSSVLMWLAATVLLQAPIRESNIVHIGRSSTAQGNT